MEKEVPWHTSSFWLDSLDCHSLCLLLWHLGNHSPDTVAANLIASFLKPPESLSHLQIIAYSKEGEPTKVQSSQFGLQRLKRELLAPLGGEILTATNSTHFDPHDFGFACDFHAFGFACDPGTVKIVCNGSVAHIETRIPCLALAPDGFSAAVSLFVEGNTCIQILDTFDYKIEHTVRLGGMIFEVHAMIFAPNCVHLAASDSDIITLIDVILGNVVWQGSVTDMDLSASGGQIFDWLAFSPDSNALAIAAYDCEGENRVRILDASAGRRIRSSFLHGSYGQMVSCIVYSPCGSAVALSGQVGIYILNVDSGELRRLFIGHPVGVVVYTPCGGSLAIDWEDRVRIINVHSGAVAYEFQLKDSGFEIASLSYAISADTARGID